MQKLQLPSDRAEEFLKAVHAAACPPPRPQPEPEPEPEPEPQVHSRLRQEASFEAMELEIDFSSGEEQTEAQLMAEMTEDDQRNYRQEKVERYYKTKEWFLEVCLPVCWYYSSLLHACTSGYAPEWMIRGTSFSCIAW
jgi:hypothetical protein